MSWRVLEVCRTSLAGGATAEAPEPSRVDGSCPGEVPGRRAGVPDIRRRCLRCSTLNPNLIRRSMRSRAGVWCYTLGMGVSVQNVRFSVTLPRDVLRVLKELAAAEDRSISGFLRRLVLQALKQGRRA